MDAQAQNSVSVSDKDQLSAPPGWTKKLVPAKAKFITLRKYDVIFIAPDGQEVKSKWHLNRYLKAHPEGPAPSEFIWSSGEETTIRRSARFATSEDSEINNSVSKKKGKRNASEMDAEETEEDQVKTPVRKRAKKASKPAGSVDKSAVEDEVDVTDKDEVMHEVQDEAIACDNEATQDAAPVNEVQKDGGNDQSLVEAEADKEAVTEEAATEKAAADESLVDVEASKEAVIEKPSDDQSLVEVEASKEAVTEKAIDDQSLMEVEVSKEAATEKAIDEGLEKQVEAENTVLSNATNSREHKELEVVGVKEQDEAAIFGSATDDVPQAELGLKGTPETSPLVAPSDELKDGDISMESEKPPEHADDNLVDLKEPLGQIFEVEKDVSYKVTMETSVIQELDEDNGKPLEPLMQKEEQERLLSIQNSPLREEHTKERGPSEFSNSPVPNQ